jgi:hypothetical protein
MLLRLILAILIAALAMPAMALGGCHDDVPAAVVMTNPAMAPSMPMEKHDSIAAEHVCAGCIPPSTWQSGVSPAPMLTSAVPLASLIATLDLAPPAPPATPPPRRIA